jgi:PleD family two-component response regulator
MRKGNLPMAQLLILEDDRITALALQRAVTRIGHTVVARTFSAAEALAGVQAHHPDVVLLDIHLRGPRDGLSVGADIQALWSTPSFTSPARILPDSACLMRLTHYYTIYSAAQEQTTCVRVHMNWGPDEAL